MGKLLGLKLSGIVQLPTNLGFGGELQIWYFSQYNFVKMGQESQELKFITTSKSKQSALILKQKHATMSPRS